MIEVYIYKGEGLPLMYMPCQCIDSPSFLDSEFVTSTTSLSPERASIVGPGNSSIELSERMIDSSMV